MPRKTHEFLEHTADIRVRIFGGTLRKLFQNALSAFADLVTDPKKIRPRASRRIRVEAKGQDLLLVRFLKELLFLFDTKAFLPRRLELERMGDTICGRVWGERFSPKRHLLKTEIKAVTYHGLKVRKGRKGWVAEVIFDV